jgi:hypothetical protein
VGTGRRESEQRQLVDEARHVFGRHVRCNQLRRLHLESPIHSPPDLRRLNTVILRAHPLEHVE